MLLVAATKGWDDEPELGLVHCKLGMKEADTQPLLYPKDMDAASHDP